MLKTITVTKDSASGYVTNWGNTWATVQSATVGLGASPLDPSVDGINIWITSYPGGTYNLQRGFGTFSLTGFTGITIKSAQFRFYSGAIANPNTWSFSIYKGTQSSSLVVADYDNFETTQFVDPVALSTMTSSNWNTVDFNAAGIAYLKSVMGSTAKLCYRLSGDYGNSAPTGNNWLPIASASSANPSQLLITYEPGGSFIYNMI